MIRSFRLPLAAAFAIACAVPAAHAAIVVTEVDSRGNDNSYGKDWIELTNTGAAGVNVNSWKVNDDSGGLGTAAAIGGVGTLAAGQSAIVFLEVASGDLANRVGLFSSAWFNNATPPAGLVFGFADGSGLGLGASGDQINLWDTSNALLTSLSFGSANANATFDNAAGATSGTLSTISVAGVNGAFASLSATNAEIGSPGTIAPVPLPAAAWLLMSGAGLLAPMVRRRRQKTA